ncbi:MAG: hypothetical protein RL376_1499 [Verrucomicrobiota bacterium]|jgi:ribosomal protein L32
MPRPSVAARTAPPECPVCGADLPPHARVCPECGADKNTGWDEDTTRYDGLDLPDSAFSDDSAPPSPPRRRSGRPHPAWLLVALGLAALFTFFALFGR